MTINKLNKKIIIMIKCTKWKFANIIDEYSLGIPKKSLWSYLIIKQKLNKNVINSWKAK
jgi:hypothetical protein